MHVHHADQPVIGVSDQQRGDFVKFHQPHRFSGEPFRSRATAAGRHDLVDRRRAQIDLLFQRAAQVAVGVDANNAVLSVDHGGHAQPLTRHLQQRDCHRRTWRNFRQTVTAVHHIGNLQQQPAAQRTARMRHREVFGGETTGVEQGDRQRIPHRQRGRGRRGGREVHRASLLVDRHVQMDVGHLRHRRVRLARHRDQRRAHALDQRQDRHDLGGFARIADRQYHVLARDHAQVAMAGFTGVDEERRRAGGRQRRGDLAADVARLAHAGNDDAPSAGHHALAGADEVGVDPRQQALQAVALDFEHAAPHVQYVFWVQAVRHGSDRSKRGLPV